MKNKNYKTYCICERCGKKVEVDTSIEILLWIRCIL